MKLGKTVKIIASVIGLLVIATVGLMIYDAMMVKNYFKSIKENNGKLEASQLMSQTTADLNLTLTWEGEQTEVFRTTPGISLINAELIGTQPNGSKVKLKIEKLFVGTSLFGGHSHMVASGIPSFFISPYAGGDYEKLPVTISDWVIDYDRPPGTVGQVKMSASGIAITNDSGLLFAIAKPRFTAITFIQPEGQTDAETFRASFELTGLKIGQGNRAIKFSAPDSRLKIGFRIFGALNLKQINQDSADTLNALADWASAGGKIVINDTSLSGFGGTVRLNAEIKVETVNQNSGFSQTVPHISANLVFDNLDGFINSMRTLSIGAKETIFAKNGSGYRREMEFRTFIDQYAERNGDQAEIKLTFRDMEFSTSRGKIRF